MERIIYKVKNGEIIKGTIFNILLKHTDFTLIDLRVYSDGEINCLGPITLDKLKDHLTSGKLTRTLPAKAKLFIPNIGHVVAEKEISSNSNERFLSLIEDTIEKLKSNSDAATECILFFREWLIHPSGENFEKLKLSYHKLPNGQNALFEVEYKDPLVKLMNNADTSLAKEQRIYYLTDYFEGEWIDLE